MDLLIPFHQLVTWLKKDGGGNSVINMEWYDGEYYVQLESMDISRVSEHRPSLTGAILAAIEAVEKRDLEPKETT